MLAATKENTTNTARDSMVNEGGHTSNNLKEAAQQFKDDARNTASAVKDDVVGVAHRSGQHARELADSAGHNLSDASETMMGYVREKPFKSGFIALGVGLVVGMLFARR